MSGTIEKERGLRFNVLWRKGRNGGEGGRSREGGKVRETSAEKRRREHTAKHAPRLHVAGKETYWVEEGEKKVMSWRRVDKEAKKNSFAPYKVSG